MNLFFVNLPNDQIESYEESNQNQDTIAWYPENHKKKTNTQNYCERMTQDHPVSFFVNVSLIVPKHYVDISRHRNEHRLTNDLKNIQKYLD